jgi:hypothetical protein
LKEPTSKDKEDRIYIDGKWMEGSALFSNQSFVTSIAEFCEDSGRGLFCLATFIFVHITDATAQAGNNDSWPEYFSNAKQ